MISAHHLPPGFDPDISGHYRQTGSKLRGQTKKTARSAYS
jgi:hypothetical protein